MHGRSLGSSFLDAKYILYPANKIDGRTNPFQKFILIYLFCAICFAFENHLNNSNIGSLPNFRIILWSHA